MRFLFTAARYHTNQHHAVKALLDAGHDVEFFSLRQGQTEIYSALHPTVLGYSSVFLRAALALGKADDIEFAIANGFPPLMPFWKAFRLYQPDAVIVRNPNTAYGMLSSIVARLSGAKVIFYTQGPKHRRYTSRQQRLRRLLLRAFAAEWMTPVLGHPELDTRPLPSVHYVPFPMPVATPLGQRDRHPNERIRLLSIGKFEPRKNHEVTLRALHRLKDHEQHLSLTIIGECTTPRHRQEKARLEGVAATLGISSRVSFKTNLPYPSLQNEYPQHDLYVLVSRDEPATVSNLEAMAHSMPTIVSDANGTACYVVHARNGFVVRTDDVDDLAEHIAVYADTPHCLREMGARSYQLVLEHHNPADYVRVLTHIAGNGRS